VTAAGALPRTFPSERAGYLWPLGGVLSAVALVGLATVHPALPFAVVAGGAAVASAVFRPKLFALLTVLAVVLTTALEALLGQAGGYVAPAAIAWAAVAFSARRLVTEGRLVWLPGGAWFLAFLCAGLLSSAAADVPVDNTVMAGYAVIRGAVLAFALAQLRWTRDDLVVLVRVGIAAVVVMAGTGAVNLLAPDAWAQLTTGRPPTTRIGPVSAPNGIFQGPAAFSRFCSVLAVGALTYGLVVRRSAANTVVTLLSGALVLVTVAVKSIIGLLVASAAVSLRFLRPAGVAAIASLGPLVVVLAAGPLSALVATDVSTYSASTSARSLLAAGGVALANQNFPLGIGFGRYGSAVAAQDYSPVYYELGFAERWGLGPGPEAGRFLVDTQWPSLLGEVGWLGTACFAAGLLCLLLSLARRTSTDEAPLVRWIRIAGIAWMLQLLVEAVASPAFVSPPSYPFLFGAAGIAASFRQAAREKAAPRRRPVLTVSGRHRARRGG
jgi:hypothetical protein